MFTLLFENADPDRPKNDKATIITDTVQVLKDLTAEVTRLKADYTALSEESREVMFSLCIVIMVLKPIIYLFINLFLLRTADTGEK